jgi:hypothetical protein
MNIRFIPLSNPQNIPNPSEGWPQAPDHSPGLVLDTGPGQRLVINLLPSGIHRDARIGRDFGIRVSLAGLELGATTLINDDIAFFLQVAAELLGWKMIRQDQNYGTRQAFRLAGLNAEAGLAFKVASQFIVRIGIGGSADFNMGGGTHGFAIQSDQEAYARLAISLSRFVQIAARIGIVNVADTSFGGSRSVVQIMSTLSILFE